MTKPVFPTPHVLAQFASKTYEDYKTGDTDAQYETCLDISKGWKLLTTASNGGKANGYLGQNISTLRINRLWLLFEALSAQNLERCGL